MVERKYRRIAVIGLPCVVQAIARMRASENDLLVPYGNAVRLVVGLFCTESFDYDRLVEGRTPGPSTGSSPGRSGGST